MLGGCWVELGLRFACFLLLAYFGIACGLLPAVRFFVLFRVFPRVPFSSLVFPCSMRSLSFARFPFPCQGRTIWGAFWYSCFCFAVDLQCAPPALFGSGLPLQVPKSANAQYALAA